MNEKKRIHLCLAKMSDTGAEQRYIQEAFETHWVAPLGPNVDAFEADLEAFVNELKAVEPSPCHSQGGSCESRESMGGKSTFEAIDPLLPLKPAAGMTWLQKHKQAAGMTCFPEPVEGCEGPTIRTGVSTGSTSLLDKRVAALSSCTAALHLALLLLGVGKDDEVISQSFSFCASTNPVTYCGARPVFVDSDKDTWNMSPELLEEAIKDRMAKTGRKPKAIIVVDLYGMPAQWEAIEEISRRYEIPVIEDAANAMGSFYKGKPCGTFGALATFSFNGNKIITTSGGGAIICPNEATKQRAIFLATQARENALHYQHEVIGYNYRMSNICAGIGRGQMTVLQEHIDHHKHVHELYINLLGNRAKVQTNPSEDYNSNFWLSTATFGKDVDVTTLCKALNAAGIEARPLWKPMHLQPVYKDAPAFINGVSEALFNNGLCLPSGPWVTDEDVRYIVDCIRKNIK